MYRSADHLPFDFTQPDVTMDPVTGLVNFDDPKLHRLSSDQVVALHHRLGNVTPIAELRQEMAAIANNPVRFGNAGILYSETQGGDYTESSPLEREWEGSVAKFLFKTKCSDDGFAEKLEEWAFGEMTVASDRFKTKLRNRT